MYRNEGSKWPLNQPRWRKFFVPVIGFLYFPGTRQLSNQQIYITVQWLHLPASFFTFNIISPKLYWRPSASIIIHVSYIVIFDLKGKINFPFFHCLHYTNPWNTKSPVNEGRFGFLVASMTDAQWSGGVTKPIWSFSHITIFLAFWETFRYVMMENQCFV